MGWVRTLERLVATGTTAKCLSSLDGQRGPFHGVKPVLPTVDFSANGGRALKTT